MGRILGIDYGTRRIGAAISDPRHSIATPLEIHQSQTPDRDAKHYRELVDENEVERIVVGLPLHTSGQESELSRQARRWGEWLAGITGVPVVFHDERYSSREAEFALQDAGIRRARRGAKRDMIAACLILQSYLDAAGRPAPAGPLADDP